MLLDGPVFLSWEAIFGAERKMSFGLAATSRGEIHPSWAHDSVCDIPDMSSMQPDVWQQLQVSSARVQVLLGIDGGVDNAKNVRPHAAVGEGVGSSQPPVSPRYVTHLLSTATPQLPSVAPSCLSRSCIIMPRCIPYLPRLFIRTPRPGNQIPHLARHNMTSPGQCDFSLTTKFFAQISQATSLAGPLLIECWSRQSVENSANSFSARTNTAIQTVSA